MRKEKNCEVPESEKNARRVSVSIATEGEIQNDNNNNDSRGFEASHCFNIHLTVWLVQLVVAGVTFSYLWMVTPPLRCGLISLFLICYMTLVYVMIESARNRRLKSEVDIGDNERSVRSPFSACSTREESLNTVVVA